MTVEEATAIKEVVEVQDVFGQLQETASASLDIPKKGPDSWMGYHIGFDFESGRQLAEVPVEDLARRRPNLLPVKRMLESIKQVNLAALSPEQQETLALVTLGLSSDYTSIYNAIAAITLIPSDILKTDQVLKPEFKTYSGQEERLAQARKQLPALYLGAGLRQTSDPPATGFNEIMWVYNDAAQTGTSLSLYTGEHKHIVDGCMQAFGKLSKKVQDAVITEFSDPFATNAQSWLLEGLKSATTTAPEAPPSSVPLSPQAA